MELSQGSATQRKEADVLLSRVSVITRTGLSTEERSVIEKEERARQAEEKYSREFRSGVIFGRMSEEEMRRREAEYRATVNEYWGRPTTETYVGGPTSGQSGVLVPMEFQRATLNKVAQYTPLLDPTLVTLDESGDYSLRGKVFPGWDLTTYKAVRVNDVTQMSPNDNAAPAAYAAFTKSYIYRTSLAIALELEQDSASDGGIVESLSKAYAIAFARGIGADLINGNGTTQPQGLLNGAVDTQNAEPLSFNFLCDLFWNLNRLYRASDKCAWVMHDDAYQAIRKLTDNNGRPLINIVDDKELLFGKRVVISPDMPHTPANTSPATSGKIIFGDLSSFVVRVSRMTVQRAVEAGLPGGVGSVDRGECLLNGRMRCDAIVHDASLGAVPPILVATFPH